MVAGHARETLYTGGKKERYKSLQLLIITNLWLHNGRFTCRRVPLRDFHWVPHSSAPLSGRVFKGQEDPRCIEPGICRVVWHRRLPLRERTGKQNERKNISLVPRRSFPARSINLVPRQSLLCHPCRYDKGGKGESLISRLLTLFGAKFAWRHQQTTRYQVPLRALRARLEKITTKDLPEKKSAQLHNVLVMFLKSTSESCIQFSSQHLFFHRDAIHFKGQKPFLEAIDM